MNTETTDNTNATLMYDDMCEFCRRWARRLEPALRRRGITMRPLPAGREWEEMQLRIGSGETLAGADAAVYLARCVWWMWPVWIVSRLPGAMPVLRQFYRLAASNRYCLNGRCEIKSVKSVWPAVLCPLTALAWRPMLPAWGFMWAMVAALVAGAMSLTGWRPKIGEGRAWSGIGNVALGATLFWGVARWVPVGQGWVGMIGLVLMLHFGLVSCLMPIMREPLRALSVSEFWGARWNRVFPEMMRPFVFEPVARRWSATAATVAVFGASGLLHELVISLPARGGYGLPTLYFLLQAAGVIVERRVAAGYRRMFAWAVVVGPLFWLFHPLFVARVVIPMMEAMGAL